MSTLRRTSHLLNLWPPLRPGLILGLSLGLAGCSATSGPRTGAASKAKTFLSVGDKPLPVVSGEPGSSLAADSGSELAPPESRRRVRPDGRISGRVYDADGRPVPEARVRLAVSGAPGGKVVTATTDRSGAFTLHGLRPGSNYTVIAETDGDRGVETGRADARTADTDVRISLGAQDDAPVHASNSVRVDRVSDREPVDEPESGPEAPAHDDARGKKVRPASPANEEDLPPAPEAEAMAPAGSGSVRSRAPASLRRASTSGDAWKRGHHDRAEPSTPAEPRDESRQPSALDHSRPKDRGTAEPEVAPVDPEARGTGAPAAGPTPLPDDGENPLPPALERVPEQAASADGAEPAGQVPRTAPAGGELPPDGPTFVAAGGLDPDLALLDPPSTPTRPLAASSPFESPSHPTGTTTSSPPVDAAPGAIVVVPETFGPVVVHQSDPFAGLPTPTPARAASRPGSRPKRSSIGSPEPRDESRLRAATGETPDPPAPPSQSGIERQKSRPTWGQVVADVSTSRDPAVTEAADRRPAEPPGPRAAAARSSVAVRTSGPSRPGRVTRPAKTYGKAVCEYDDRLRQIIDFRLPDLDGKPVRFHDLDTDLVLIDFWGTWCQPCLRSIPHLVELQERMGKRLTVVGVACESDSPEASAPHVIETIRRLNVNYPVLLSRNDGTCPLQEALHIQAFPTMILVDRQGRVLWRDQGATPATLARLDRMISSSPKPGETRRY